MTMNVVRPARASVAKFVPRSVNLKYWAIASTSSGPSISLSARRPARARSAPPGAPSTPGAPSRGHRPISSAPGLRWVRRSRPRIRDRFAEHVRAPASGASGPMVAPTKPHGESNLQAVGSILQAVRPGGPAISVLGGLQAQEFHLDEARRVERELVRFEWGPSDGLAARRELQDDPLVPLDEAVFEHLVGPCLELEVLKRVHVERHRDRREERRDLGLVHDDPLHQTRAVRNQLAAPEVAVGHRLLEERSEEVEHVLAG